MNSSLQLSSGPPELILELFRASHTLFFLCGKLRDIDFCKLQAGHIPRSPKGWQLTAWEQQTVQSMVHNSTANDFVLAGVGTWRSYRLCSSLFCPYKIPHTCRHLKKTHLLLFQATYLREGWMESEPLKKPHHFGCLCFALKMSQIERKQNKRTKKETHLWHLLLSWGCALSPVQNGSYIMLMHNGLRMDENLHGNTPEVRKEQC